MFCKNCGKQSTGNQKFCTNCGATLSETIPPQKSIPSDIKNKTISGLILAGIVALVVWGSYSSSKDEAAIKTNNDALSNYDLGNTQQAITQFQEASQNAVSSENKINTLKNLGYVYSSEGQVDLSIGAFQEALSLTSEGSFDYYLISGEIASRQNKPSSALMSYKKAYEKNPEDFQINNALALFYIDIADAHPQYVDYKKGLEHALKASQLTDLQIAKQNLGAAYYFNENYPQAISVLSSITVDKDTYTAYLLGLSYARNDDPVNAKFYLRKAIANGVTVPQEVYNYINSH